MIVQKGIHCFLIQFNLLPALPLVIYCWWPMKVASTQNFRHFSLHMLMTYCWFAFFFFSLGFIRKPYTQAIDVYWWCGVQEHTHTEILVCKISKGLCWTAKIVILRWCNACLDLPIGLYWFSLHNWYLCCISDSKSWVDMYRI